MKNVIGGYANLNLYGIDIEEQVTIPGLYDEAAELVKQTDKPIIIHDMVFDGVEVHDAFVEKVTVNEDSIVLDTGAYTITIAVSDITVAEESERGGGGETYTPQYLYEALFTAGSAWSALEHIDLTLPISVKYSTVPGSVVTGFAIVSKVEANTKYRVTLYKQGTIEMWEVTEEASQKKGTFTIQFVLED